VTLALVALGGNVEPRRMHLLSAAAELGGLPRTRVLAVSSLHATEPVGCPPGSGPFLNGACLLETELSPRALLNELLALELRHGRRRGLPNAPRTLDLDLLLHGEAVLDEPGLLLPHPRMHQRAFVLEPAVEVAPDMRHPQLGRTLLELRDALRAAGGAESACES
jgi:2-amino-4-hydroxy-6-hydroxymethyldihydropteridine diphosphokinase